MANLAFSVHAAIVIGVSFLLAGCGGGGATTTTLSPEYDEHVKWVSFLPQPEDGDFLVFDSSPVVGADGTVLATAHGSDGGFLYAFHENDGAFKWKIEIQGSDAEKPAIGADGTIFVQVMNSSLESASVYAVNSANGTVKWVRHFGTAGHQRGREGKTTTHLGSGHTSSGGSPAIGTDGTVFVSFFGGGHIGDDAGVYALDSNTGSIKWQLSFKDGMEGSPWGSPIFAPNGRIVYDSYTSLYMLHSTNGSLIWNVSLPVKNLIAKTLSPNDTVLMCEEFYGMTAVDLHNGSTTWHSEKYCRTYQSAPAVGRDGTIFVAGSENTKSDYFLWDLETMYALAFDGSLKWNYTVVGGGRFGVAAVIPDGTVYVCMSGSLYAMDGNTGTLKWSSGRLKSDSERNVCDTQWSSVPAVGSDGTVFTNNFKTLAAFYGESTGAMPHSSGFDERLV